MLDYIRQSGVSENMPRQENSSLLKPTENLLKLLISVDFYDIIYRQIKMVDGHSLGGLRVRTRSQNSSVTDHGF